MKLRKMALALILSVVLSGIPTFASDALGWTVTTPNPKTHRNGTYWTP